VTAAAAPGAAPSPPAALPPWRRLHVRAAITVLLVLAALGAATGWISWRQERDGALEAMQRLNLGLAATIAGHLPVPLIDAAGHVDAAPMRAMAAHVMMLNPSAEVYLLDATGRVRAHALGDLGRDDPVGRLVDLAPVHALLAPGPTPPMLPIAGTDPRDPRRRAIFSVAALPGATPAAASPPGFLYVVLRHPEPAPFALSGSLQAGLLSLVGATLAAILVLVGVLRRLTRPLDVLTRRVQAYRRDDVDAAADAPADEIALLERAIDDLQRRIEQQIACLEDADRQRRELVGHISHDLRTPLAAIQGYVETVLIAGDRLDPPERERHLRTALRHADQLDHRVKALFELSTLEAGRVAPQVEVFCLAELLQDVVGSYELEARQRGVAIALDAQSHQTTRVKADIALIERVLQNLVDNALRHTPAGGSVTLSIATDGDDVEVSIVDTGQGIPPEHLPHIFERFWRGGSDAPTATRPAESGGLGLAIVKRILDLHGSTVHVRSAPAAGSCFRFALPQAA
jgi:signal transduction histidine kinase